jgi:hypothetical protein
MKNPESGFPPTSPVEAETPVALRAPSVSASTGNPEFWGWGLGPPGGQVLK